jgi:undecaprenyl-diphosphatase
VNGALFDAINDLAGHVAVADTIMEATARYGAYVVVALVCLSWFVRDGGNTERRLGVYTAVIAAVIALAITKVIQHEYVHQRPFVLRHDDVTQLIEHSADASFPSEHTTAAFGLAVGLGLYRLRWGILLVAIAALQGFARIYVGIHYPYDILAGAGIGTLAAAGVFVARPLIAWLDEQFVVRLVPTPLR